MATNWFHYIEYEDVTTIKDEGDLPETLQCEIASASILGFVEDRGLCICIALPYAGSPEDERHRTSQMWERVWEKKDDYFVIWLCSYDTEDRIPLRVSEGNEFDKRFNTSCLFGYLSAALFDALPEMKRR